MAYTKQTWTDRKVEKPLTFLMTTNADGSITLTPYPGVVEQEGSQLSADRFNHIENGLSNVDTRLVAVEPVSGDWTPALNTVEGKAPTVEYSARVGKFKRIGKLCFLSFYISGKITALNGTDNYGVIVGIPYVTSSTFGQNALCTGLCYNLTEEESTIQLVPNSNENAIRIQTNNGALACKLKVTPTSLNPYFQIAGSGWYEIA